MVNASWQGSRVIAAGTGNNFTSYFPVGMGPGGLETNEARHQSRSPAGDYSALYCRVTVNARITATTLRLRVNGANSALAIAVPAGTTGWFSNTSDTVTVANDDLVNFSWSTSTGGGQITFNGLAGLQFVPTTGNTVAFYGTGGSASSRFSVTDTAFALTGQSVTNGASTELQQELRTAGTASHARMFVSLNGKAATSTFALNVNGVDSALSISVTASTTGTFENTGSTVAIASGDVVYWHATSSAGGNLDFFGVRCRILSGNSSFDVSAGKSATSNNFTGTSPGYLPLWGDLPNSIETTEATYQGVLPFAGAVSQLVVHVVNHVLATDPCVYTLRKNGADTALTISVPANTTGFFRDTTHSVAAAGGDLLCVSQYSGASGSLMRTNQVAARINGGSVSTDVYPDPEELELEGLTPTIEAVYGPISVYPAAEELEIEGLTPIKTAPIGFYPAAEELEIEGLAPTVVDSGSYSVYPAAEELEISGGVPDLVAEKRASQMPVLALGNEAPSARSSNLPTLVAAEVTPEGAVSQMPALALAEVVPPVAVSQMPVLLLVGDAPCVSKRCQLWRITRQDGEVFRFTSLDRDFLWGTERFKSCGSLAPSASESESSLEAVGSIELNGVIDDESITEADLYSGLFDNAFVEVWLVPWEDPTDYTRRLAAGWTGALSMGESSFRMEVLGPSSRLKQQAMVKPYTATCRWHFGGQECGVDTNLLISAATVVSSSNRAEFIAEIDSEDTSFQYENGLVIWQSGVNNGQVIDVKSVDLGTGEIVLWGPCWFRPQPGDTFALQPGCDHTFEGGCTVYNNKVRFGGFKDIPGNDKIQERPDAKY